MRTDDLPAAHQRAQRDLDASRAWKARDRLSGYLADHPHDQATLERLGAICHALGDLPAAGRYWALTTRDDEAASAARAALDERCGGAPIELLRQMDPRTPLDAYPPAVQLRIRELRGQLPGEAGWWEPRPPRRMKVPSQHGDARRRWYHRVGNALIAAAVIVVFPVAWLVGIGTLAAFLVNWLR